jgi:VIT1/CCC1 family predicted Fe2+/Mn2+ transporter
MKELLDTRAEQRKALAKRLNWLRAGVLGANDGIVSTAGIVMGVAGATVESGPILIAGVAALVAGSISMAGGEYASVSAQRDSEIAALAKERKELQEDPSRELEELASYYRKRGISDSLAMQVALDLSAKDLVRAHGEAELGISTDEHVSPIAAAIASFIAFALGSILPIVAISGPWIEYREVATVGSVVIALALTGFFGAKIGGAKPLRAVARNVVVSLLTMGIAYAIGGALGVAVG